MRPRWYAPRLLKWHLLMVVIVSGCSYAAWWQFHRAAGGNTLSYLYSIEWPAFAVCAVIGWWQLIREPTSEFEARKEERRQLSLPKPVAYDQEILRQELAAHPELVRAFPELTKAFPELAGQLPAPPGGQGLPAGQASAPAAAAEGQAGKGPVAVPAAAGPVPDQVVAAPSEDLRAYNEVLGAMAARGKPKTWRNPRGAAEGQGEGAPADQGSVPGRD